MTRPPRTRAEFLRDALLMFVCIGFVAALLVAVIASFRAGHAEDSASSAKVDASTANVAVAANHDAVSALAAQVRALGGTPVVQPSALPTVHAPAPLPPTDAQVQAAVAAYLTAHPVTAPKIDYTKLRAYVITYLAQHPAPSGAPGANGTDGQNATDAQVAEAVAAYLTAHPPAPGTPGQDGTDGKDGADGQNGQPPVSWTYQIGAVTYECDRATPFDASAPTYTCAVQPIVPTGGASS